MNGHIATTKMIEDNLAEYQVAMAECLPGATVANRPKVLWVATTTPFSMYNGVFRSTFDETSVASDIDEIKQEFMRRKIPMGWMLGPSSTPSNLAQHLLDHDFQHYEDEPGMALDLQSMNEDFAAPDDFEIRLVQSDQALQDWVSVWSYDSQEIVPALVDIHRQFGYDTTVPWRYYLGVKNGRAVATSLLFLGKTSVSVNWVVTVPEARKQGIGAIMTLAALRDARAEGYSYAILTASPFGERIYKRIGFESYCTISKYIWKP